MPPPSRAGLSHAQFEASYPFLDGSSGVGGLLIRLLVGHWRLLRPPLLYLGVAINRRRSEYYKHLGTVRL